MPTVLIVEDNIYIAKLIKTCLHKKGFSGLSACNGKKGLALLKEQEVDLVISDLKMPEMDGPTFIKEIRKRKQWKDLPIFVLSAYCSPDIEKSLRQSGVKQFISLFIGSAVDPYTKKTVFPENIVRDNGGAVASRDINGSVECSCCVIDTSAGNSKICNK